VTTPISTRLAAINPVWLVLVSIASVQVGASFAKQLFVATTPHATAWLRLVFASVIFLVIARPRVTGRPRRDWAIVLAYGAALAGMNWAIYLSFSRIPIGLAVTIEFLGPLAVAVWGSRRPRDLLWVALAGLGVMLLGFQPTAVDLIGIGLALLAGALWAGYIVLAGPTGRRWEGVTGVTVANVVGAVAMTLPAMTLGTPAFTWPIVGVAAVVGLLSSVIPYGLEMIALRRITPGVFGILMSLEPAAAALAALVVLGEQLAVVEWLAMGCVVIASAGATRGRSPQVPID
jgi:inner membrane transporter RhtA